METSKPKKTPCPKCGNPLRLAGVQPGEEVRCPKCNAPFAVGGEKGKAVVPAPPRVVAVNPLEGRAPGELPIARPASTASADDDDDAYEPEIPLIPSVIGVPVDVVDARLGETAEGYHDVDWSMADDMDVERSAESSKDHAEQHLESARRRGLVRNYGTPDPPRWTFFSGVFGYPWRGLNIGRWALASVLISVAAVLDVQALEMLGLLGGDLTKVAMTGLFIGVLAIGATLFAGMFTAPVLQAGVQDTADGHDLPQDGTFPDWDQWLFTLLGWVMVGAGAAAIGYPLSLAIGPVGMLISFLLLFPVLLLSAMETDSYIVPISAPVMRSLGYCAGSWFKFYLVSSVMLLGVFAAIVRGSMEVPTLTWLLAGPVLAATALIYARLLGRLAWKASGATMAPVELDLVAEPGGEVETLRDAQPAKRKKRSRVKIVVPEEIDRREPPSQRPKISFHHRD